MKRHFQAEGTDGAKRFATAVRDVLRGISLNDLASQMEPLLRRVVREEVERAILPFRPSLRSSVNPIETSEERRLQLHFVNKLPPTIFTGTRMEAEDTNPIKIVLFDTGSNSAVASGPLSSIKIEILVLNGDFGSVDHEDWTEREFNDNVVREREGKRPLLTGERNITLKEGVGYIGDIVFTDNSSWIRSRRFRLGARIVQRISGEMKIREARSEAFVVKDHRGELYKKHHPPSLGDKVWRLEKIAKDGALDKRLASYRIRTVKDFLQLYETNPLSLRKILGGVSEISNRIWETIIAHATTCEVNDCKSYIYSQAAQGVVLVFNSIYKVKGAIFDDQYMSLNELTFSQRRLVEGLKLQAYKNVKDIVPIEESSIVGLSGHLTSLQANPSSGPNLGLQHLDFPVAYQGQWETQQGLNQPSTPTSYSYEAENNNQFEVSSAAIYHQKQAQKNGFSLGDLFIGSYNGGIDWSPSGSQGPLEPSNELITESIPQVQTSTYFPLNATMGQESDFFFTPSNIGGFFSPLPDIGVHISRNGKPKAGWCKLRAAIKFGILVRRDIAAKRMERFLF